MTQKRVQNKNYEKVVNPLAGTVIREEMFDSLSLTFMTLYHVKQFAKAQHLV